jgi:hypothetical protein
MVCGGLDALPNHPPSTELPLLLEEVLVAVPGVDPAATGVELIARAALVVSGLDTLSALSC